MNICVFKLTTSTLGVFFVAAGLIATPALSQNRSRPSGNPQMNNAQSGDSRMGGSELGNYRYPPADKWIPLDASKREPINRDLQATVVELLELYHDAKQSHWNLRGPLYFPLHHALQEYAEQYLKYTDTMAERQLEIGIPADGRTNTIVQTNNLSNFPGGFLSDRDVLQIMTERIYTVAERVRDRIESTSKNGDDVTSNLLQELSYTLDKQVWQFRAHMQ